MENFGDWLFQLDTMLFSKYLWWSMQNISWMLLEYKKHNKWLYHVISMSYHLNKLNIHISSIGKVWWVSSSKLFLKSYTKNTVLIFSGLLDIWTRYFKTSKKQKKFLILWTKYEVKMLDSLAKYENLSSLLSVWYIQKALSICERMTPGWCL